MPIANEQANSVHIGELPATKNASSRLNTAWITCITTR